MKSMLTLAACFGLFQAAGTAGAEDICGMPARTWSCPAPAAVACAPPTVEKTVLVPEIVTEYRTITVPRRRPEVRERTVVVNRSVPETREVPREEVVMVPQTRTRVVNQVVYRHVPRDIQLRTTVMVPHTEMHQATRAVTRMVPVEEQRTVCEDVGHWAYPSASQPYTAGYGGQAAQNNAAPAGAVPSPAPGAAPTPPQAGPRTFAEEAVPPPPPTPGGADANVPPALPQASSAAPGPTCESPCQTCRTACNQCGPVWVPQVVQRNITVTCMKPVCQEEAYQYPVTNFQPNVRVRTVGYVVEKPETVSRQEQYTVEVPQKRVWMEKVAVMRVVPVEQREKYTVMVPYEEKKQVPVQVCRMVPRKVIEPAPPVCGD